MISSKAAKVAFVALLGATATLALAQDAATPTRAADRTLPKIETRAAPGYRLYRAGYRLSGKGALVTAQLCRLPGWAAQGPARLEVVRLEPTGDVGESHASYLPRLGIRSGNNCVAASAKLDKVPDYGEVVRVCALSGRAKCR